MLVAVGCVWPPLIRRQQQQRGRVAGLRFVFGAAILFYIFFFTWRANIDISKPLLAGTKAKFGGKIDLPHQRRFHECVLTPKCMTWPLSVPTGVLKRFMMQSSVFVAVLMASGMTKLFTLVRRNVQHPDSGNSARVAFSIATVFAAGWIAFNYEQCDQSSNYAIKTYGKVRR